MWILERCPWEPKVEAMEFLRPWGHYCQPPLRGTHLWARGQPRAPTGEHIGLNCFVRGPSHLGKQYLSGLVSRVTWHGRPQLVNQFQQMIGQACSDYFGYDMGRLDTQAFGHRNSKLWSYKFEHISWRTGCCLQALKNAVGNDGILSSCRYRT